MSVRARLTYYLANKFDVEKMKPDPTKFWVSEKVHPLSPVQSLLTSASKLDGVRVCAAAPSPLTFALAD